MLKLQVKDFDLAQTLECGQVFRFKKENSGYILQSQSYIAELRQDGNVLYVDSNFEDKSFWENYFDLNTDYKSIKDTLKKDEKIRPYIDNGWGIHILNQDFDETLISFIMSQNKQIPQIKQCIEIYCQKFGQKILFNDKYYYSFPKGVIPSLEEMRECKVGFRDKYILDALTKQKEGLFKDIQAMSEEEQFRVLTSVSGIGPKVANCILLFSLHRNDMFPIDVWIKRKFQDIYFNGEVTDNRIIEKTAKALYGKYCGYAQQYLFYGK